MGKLLFYVLVHGNDIIDKKLSMHSKHSDWTKASLVIVGNLIVMSCQMLKILYVHECDK